MKNLIRTIACFLLVASFTSCSDDDSQSSDNSNPNADVTFDGQGIEINNLSLDEYPGFRNEAIFTTLNNVSIIIYFKGDGMTYQTSDDGQMSYTADGGDHQVADYPNNSVRGYINAEDGSYRIMSGTVKVKLNASGEHKFTFTNLKSENEDGEEATLEGSVTINES